MNLQANSYRPRVEPMSLENLGCNWNPDPTPIACHLGGTTTRDECQSCWVDGAALSRGPGVGCEMGRIRREQSCAEAGGPVWAPEKEDKYASRRAAWLAGPGATKQEVSIRRVLAQTAKDRIPVSRYAVLRLAHVCARGRAYVLLDALVAEMGLGDVVTSGRWNGRNR